MFTTESIYDYLKRNNCSSEELAQRFTEALNEAIAKREKEKFNSKAKHKDALAIVTALENYINTHMPTVAKYFDDMDKDEWADALVKSFDKTSSMINMVQYTPTDEDAAVIAKFIDKMGF